MNLMIVTAAYLSTKHNFALDEDVLQHLGQLPEAECFEAYQLVKQKVQELAQEWDLTDMDEEVMGWEVYQLVNGGLSAFV